MTFRERATRARFQIALEQHRAVLTGKLYRRDQFPRFVAGGVRTMSGVVCVESRSDIRSQADVVTIRLVHAPKNVYEVLDREHEVMPCKTTASLHLMRIQLGMCWML